MIRIITFSIALTFLLSAPAFAQSLPSTPPPGTPPTGGVCDFGQFLNALGQRESSNNYAADNGQGYLGRWQFGKLALEDIGWYSPGVGYTGRAQSYGVTDDASWLSTPAAQDQAMKEWMDLLHRRGQTFGMGQYIGQTFPACPNTPVTWSGIIAGRHLCGYGFSLANGGGTNCGNGRSLRQYFESGGSVDGQDGNNTPVSQYVCMFSGLNMPYEHGGQATDCSTVNNAGEPINSGTTIPTPPTGAGHTPLPPPSPAARFQAQSQHIQYIWVSALQQMTVQLTTTMMQQMQILGSFFDAKHQLETQRIFQEKTARAHKDYHPSEQMCEIGTFVRNLKNTERRADLTQEALARSMIDRALASGDVKTLESGSDQETRKQAYIRTFCNTNDNAAQNSDICASSGAADQQNADINYTQTIDQPLTIDVNLTDNVVSPEEENIFTFLDYIFMSDAFPWMSANHTVLYDFIGPYQDMRSLIAIRSVAQNAFAEIIAKKTKGPDTLADSNAPQMKSLLVQMGATPADVETFLGEHPSYYAQMEILTKKIYQNPEFIINLYDKPANVKRVRAAGQAIKSMQNRDIQEALERRMMLISALKALQDRNKQRDMIVREIQPVLKDAPGEAQ